MRFDDLREARITYHSKVRRSRPINPSREVPILPLQTLQRSAISQPKQRIVPSARVGDHEEEEGHEEEARDRVARAPAETIGVVVCIGLDGGRWVWCSRRWVWCGGRWSGSAHKARVYDNVKPEL